ncbi:hypothetical protein [Nitrosospira sp. Nl5]|uniref:hypothetical protein n=1 Tax=Nitrosospira sp. Nl5 TaxID=200120 RepID=UPI0015A0C572|nr:hypothetical protein [Nitrosospira sp. Nl5]
MKLKGLFDETQETAKRKTGVHDAWVGGFYDFNNLKRKTPCPVRHASATGKG